MAEMATVRSSGRLSSSDLLVFLGRVVAGRVSCFRRWVGMAHRRPYSRVVRAHGGRTGPERTPLRLAGGR
ncbi:MAG: hypothetical protein OEY18_02550 [Candidatus Aminicenantes bacterium]|nr:hypothetical protein [Candidatus Aminicenantes bacterium]MDH5383563.1 hypothetical protein [Candidatus Aminicenantes bacterium]